MAYLARVGEVSDHSGKASTVLAATIGYPGSSIAFAQLLTGMERAGLIQREIRGKRTYRIIPGPAAPPPGAVTRPAGALDTAARTGTLPDAAARAAAPPDAAARTGTLPDAASRATPAEAAGPAPEAARRPAGPSQPAAAEPTSPPAAATPDAGHSPAGATPDAGHPPAAGPAVAGLGLPPGPGGLDYDELARRLLVQVVRRLTGPDTGRVPAGPPGGPAPSQPETALQETALQETVASLEQKLASATSRQRRLAEENSRLRAQLGAAEQSLAEAQERATAEALAGRFDSAEVLLLERLLSPLREARSRSPEADAG